VLNEYSDDDIGSLSDDEQTRGTLSLADFADVLARDDAGLQPILHRRGPGIEAVAHMPQYRREVAAARAKQQQQQQQQGKPQEQPQEQGAKADQAQVADELAAATLDVEEVPHCLRDYLFAACTMSALL
jgi:hypothetical protein